MTTDHAKPRLSWRKKSCFALLTTLTFLLVLEGSLALVGVQRVTDSMDPMVGFSGQIPLLSKATDQSDREVMHTALGKLTWFNPQSFPAAKSPGTRRVFCVGGSTTFGRPYADPTSYSGWLREMLASIDPSHQWEVFNAGGVSYASYRVAAVMEELAAYDPDLFIVYSGHNEFLERRTYEGMFAKASWSRDLTANLQRTRTWALAHRLVGQAPPPSGSLTSQLPAEVDEMLNHSVGPRDYHRDDAWHRDVERHYQWNLNRMVSIARRAGAEIVFVEPASNLRDCSPFKSDTSDLVADPIGRSTPDPDDLHALASQQLTDGEFDKALATCGRVLSSADRDPLAHYLRGRALFSLGRFAEAEESFQRAIDEDICPLRATSRIVETFRRVAREQGVLLIDFDQELRERCQSEFGHRCLGREYFFDHVHPTIEIHGQLARWIVEALQADGWLSAGTLSQDSMEQIATRINSRVSNLTKAIAARNLAKVLHWAGKFEDAMPHARQSIAWMPEDYESHFILAHCLTQTGRTEEAFVHLDIILSAGEDPKAALVYGELLANYENWEAAKSYLLRGTLTDNDEHRARAHYWLGWVYLQLDEHTSAAESLGITRELFPDDLSTLEYLAEAYLGMGEQDAGVETLERVLQIDPNNVEANLRLAMVYLSANRLAEANRHLEAAEAIDPPDEGVQAARKTLDALQVPQ